MLSPLCLSDSDFHPQRYFKSVSRERLIRVWQMTFCGLLWTCRLSSCRLKCNLCHLLGFFIADISNQYFFPQTGQQLALRNPRKDFSSVLNCRRGSSKWALITPRGQGQSAPSTWSLRMRQRQKDIHLLLAFLPEGCPNC